VSVIVPVYRDWERLGRCLAALAAQTYPATHIEIIVVDNACDGLRPPDEVFRPCVRLMEQPLPGSYAARNRAVEVARGDILAFTDSDCVPQRDWIEAAVRALTQISDAGAVGGPIELTFRDPARPTAAELYDALTAFPQEKYIRELHFSATANLVVRRDAFDRVGRFDAALRSGGDGEWGARAKARGVLIAFASDVVVRHPARRSLQELTTKARRIAGGLYDLRDDGAKAWHGAYLRDLLTYAVPPVRKAMRLLSDRRSSRTLAQRMGIVWVLFVVRYVRAIEFLRLGLGGRPQR